MLIVLVADLIVLKAGFRSSFSTGIPESFSEGLYLRLCKKMNS
jgi:hypothetical protein